MEAGGENEEGVPWLVGVNLSGRRTSDQTSVGLHCAPALLDTGSHLFRDRHVNLVCLCELADDRGRLHPFSNLIHLRLDLVDRTTLAHLLTDITIATLGAHAGRQQIAHPGKASKGGRVTAKGTKPQGQAAPVQQPYSSGYVPGKVSPTWVPVLMFGLLILGALLVPLTYALGRQLGASAPAALLGAALLPAAAASQRLTGWFRPLGSCRWGPWRR